MRRPIAHPRILLRTRRRETQNHSNSASTIYREMDMRHWLEPQRGRVSLLDDPAIFLAHRREVHCTDVAECGSRGPASRAGRVDAD